METFDAPLNFSRQKKKKSASGQFLVIKKKRKGKKSEGLKSWSSLGTQPFSRWSNNQTVSQKRDPTVQPEENKKKKTRKNPCKPKTMNATNRLVKGYVESTNALGVKTNGGGCGGNQWQGYKSRWEGCSSRLDRVVRFEHLPVHHP